MADATRSGVLKAMKALLFSSVYLDRSSTARGPLPSSRSLEESDSQRRRRRGRYVRFRRALTCGLAAALIESHSIARSQRRNCRRSSRQLPVGQRRHERFDRHAVEFWDMVTASWDDSTWIANFRVSRRTFRILCLNIRSLIEGGGEHDRRLCVNVPPPRLRPGPSVAKCVALALWRLATNIDFDTLTWLFGVSKSTARDIVRRVCKAIVTSLMPRFVNIPRNEALQEITRGFQEINGLPNVCGVIGIGHIHVVAPLAKPASVDHTIMAVQAVVDYRGLFMDCSIGWPGRMHPADILNNSPLYEKGEDGRLFDGLANVETTDGYSIPGYLIGDFTTPLLDWIVKPFVVEAVDHVVPFQNQDTIKQRDFNARVSDVRNVFVRALERLRGRWRCLSGQLDVEAKSDAPLVIAACVTLHNLCDIQGEPFNTEWFLAPLTEQLVDSRDERSSYVTIQGEELRTVLSDYPRMHTDVNQ